MTSIQNKMNIAIALNSKYMRYAYVMLTSLFIQHPHTLFQLYALHMDLTDSDKEALRSLGRQYNSEFHFLYIDPSVFSDKLPTTEAWSLEAYFRLQLTDLLSDSVERILYLDVDMIICGSLLDLYHTDFEDNLFCVCKDMSVNGHIDDIRGALFNPLLEKGFLYFNSGLMLWNIAALRGKYSFEDYMQLAADLHYKILAPDQDLLNYMHWKHVKYIDEYRYNLFGRIAHSHGVTYEDVKKETCIVHFAGYKPWSGEYVHYDIEQLWWDYAKFTPYYHELLEDFLNSSLSSPIVEETIQNLIHDKHRLKNELDKTSSLCQKLYTIITPDI